MTWASDLIRILDHSGKLVATVDPITRVRTPVALASSPWANSMPGCSALLDEDDTWQRVIEFHTDAKKAREEMFVDTVS